MKKYDIFGIGAALVDTEIVVTDHFLAEHGVGKGLMMLVGEERQDYLIYALREQTTHVKKANLWLKILPKKLDEEAAAGMVAGDDQTHYHSSRPHQRAI